MADVKWSQFPSETPSNSDEVVGLHAGNNARFSILDIIFAIRQGLANIFVPLTRTVNSKALSADITLDASDVGAVDASDVGVADGVASLDSNGKVPGTQLDLSGKQDEITASGILKGDGAGGVSAAMPGTDYQSPLTAGTDYATPDQLDGKANQVQLAYVETGTTTSRAYSVGEYFYWNGLLYRVTTAISSGGTFTPGTNCEQVTGGGLNALKDSITMKYHGDSNLSTSPGTTSLINTGIKFTTNTELILFKVHTSASGTLKININSASVIDMIMDNGQDYATFLVRSLTPGTELQVQYLGTSTANISSYYIVSIPLPGTGI